MRAKCLERTRASGQAAGKCKKQSLLKTAGKDNTFWKMLIKYINVYKIEWNKERKQPLIPTEHSMSGILWWLPGRARAQRGSARSLGLGGLSRHSTDPEQVLWPWPALQRGVISWTLPLGSENKVNSAFLLWEEHGDSPAGTELPRQEPSAPRGSAARTTIHTWPRTDRPTHSQCLAKSVRHTETNPPTEPRMPADFKNWQVTSASIRMKLKNYWWCFTQV